MERIGANVLVTRATAPRSHCDNAFARVASPEMRAHSFTHAPQAGIHIYNAHATQREHQSWRPIRPRMGVLLHVRRGMLKGIHSRRGQSVRDTPRLRIRAVLSASVSKGKGDKPGNVGGHP